MAPVLLSLSSQGANENRSWPGLRKRGVQGHASWPSGPGIRTVLRVSQRPRAWDFSVARAASSRAAALEASVRPPAQALRLRSMGHSEAPSFPPAPPRRLCRVLSFEGLAEALRLQWWDRTQTQPAGAAPASSRPSGQTPRKFTLAGDPGIPLLARRALAPRRTARRKLPRDVSLVVTWPARWLEQRGENRVGCLALTFKSLRRRGFHPARASSSVNRGRLSRPSPGSPRQPAQRQEAAAWARAPGAQECGRKVLSTTGNHFHQGCWRGRCGAEEEMGCEEGRVVCSSMAPL